MICDPSEMAGPCLFYRVVYIGFIEVTVGGILKVGDEAKVGQDTVGMIAGFDLTHSPNHINILLRGADLIDGTALGLGLGDEIMFAG